MTGITSFKIMAWGAIGATVGAVIYFAGSLSLPESQAFFRTPEFIVWFLINETLFSFYPILWVFLLIPDYKRREQPHKLQPWIICPAILLAFLFMIPLLAGAGIIDMQPLPFAYADQKILILEGVGFLVSALPISVSIWLTQAAVLETFKETGSEKDIQKYIAFHKQLQRYLTVLGVLLSLFILTGAALRSAAIAAGATTVETYPTVYLLILGVYYTGLSALVYFPAQHTLVSAGNRLLDVCFPLPALNSATWSTDYSNRKCLEELLELRITVEQRFITSITLLAPFLSSIFSFLVEK